VACCTLTFIKLITYTYTFLSPSFDRTRKAVHVGRYIREDKCAIRSGDRKPSLPTFVNILLALDISADSIIFGVPRENTVLSDFIGFLERRDIEEVNALFEIAKVASKYIGLNNKS